MGFLMFLLRGFGARGLEFFGAERVELGLRCLVMEEDLNKMPHY